MGEFICGDGGGGCGIEATWYCRRCGRVSEEGGEGACCWSEGHVGSVCSWICLALLIGIAEVKVEGENAHSLQVQKLMDCGSLRCCLELRTVFGGG